MLIAQCAVEKVLYPMLTGTFGDEWVSHESDSSGAVLVEETNERLCRSVRIPTGRHDERTPCNCYSAVDGRETNHLDPSGRSRALTMPLTYRIVPSL